MKLKRSILAALASTLLMLIGSLFIAAGFNLFLIPHELLSGGLSGIAMIIGYITGANISWLYFVLNIPVLIMGWFLLGRRFIGLSIVNVLCTVLFMQLIPQHAITDDHVLAAVFGGIILGFGTGLSLRYGGSSGGFDIIASIATKRRDLPVGMIIFILNGMVILLLVLFKNDWNVALYSLLSIYTAGKVVDIIHVRHVKITAFIVTNRTEEMLDRLLLHRRGVTVIKTRGAYSRQERDMLMTVRTKYELADLRKMILSIDPRAFVTVVETVGIIGDFYRAND